jgi:hypothetical protein
LKWWQLKQVCFSRRYSMLCGGSVGGGGGCGGRGGQRACCHSVLVQTHQHTTSPEHERVHHDRQLNVTKVTGAVALREATRGTPAEWRAGRHTRGGRQGGRHASLPAAAAPWLHTTHTRHTRTPLPSPALQLDGPERWVVQPPRHDVVEVVVRQGRRDARHRKLADLRVRWGGVRMERVWVSERSRQQQRRKTVQAGAH